MHEEVNALNERLESIRSESVQLSLEGGELTRVVGEKSIGPSKKASVDELPSRAIAIPLLRDVYGRIPQIKEIRRRMSSSSSVHSSSSSHPEERAHRLGRWSRKWNVSVADFDAAGVVVMTPLEALRRVLEVRCGSLDRAYQALDSSGSGRVSKVEFMEGLGALGIPWADATGIDAFEELYGLLVGGEEEGESDGMSLAGVLGVCHQQQQQGKMSDDQKW